MNVEEPQPIRIHFITRLRHECHSLVTTREVCRLCNASTLEQYDQLLRYVIPAEPSAHTIIWSCWNSLNLFPSRQSTKPTFYHAIYWYMSQPARLLLGCKFRTKNCYTNLRGYLEWYHLSIRIVDVLQIGFVMCLRKA